jgi:DNA mismatch repair protein MSH4
VNGLLDVARQTYRESTEDVHQLVEDMSQEYDRPLELKFEAGRGYYLCLPASGVEDRPLPPVFVNVVRKKKLVEFTTLDLVKRNSKVASTANLGGVGVSFFWRLTTRTVDGFIN